MRNSGIKVFLALLICTAYLTGFSYAGTAVWDFLSNGGRFEPNTKIASIDISGLPPKEAAKKVEDTTNQWKSENPIVLTFMDKEETLPEDALQFKTEKSVRSAADGQQNALEVSLDSMLVDSVLTNLASNDAAQIDSDLLKKQLTDSAAALASGQSYSLEQFVAGENQVIYESTLAVPADDPEILQFVQSNPEINIAAQSQWSLLKQFPQATDQNSLGLLASAVYQTALGTNFVIVERHTGIMKPDYTSPGLEARVVPGEMDYKMFNPNQTDYTLSFVLDGGNLKVSISGKPLLYTYEPVISEPEYFPFKQIIRYNPLLSVGEEKKSRSGAEGLLVQVSRRVLDSQGFSLGVEEIAEDFYPPVHEILEKRYYVPIQAVEPVINDLLNPDTGLPENDVPQLPEEPAPENPESLPPADAEPPADGEPPVEENPPVEEEPPAEAEPEQSTEGEPAPAEENEEEPIEK